MLVPNSLRLKYIQAILRFQSGLGLEGSLTEAEIRYIPKMFPSAIVDNEEVLPSADWFRGVLLDTRKESPQSSKVIQGIMSEWSKLVAEDRDRWLKPYIDYCQENNLHPDPETLYPRHIYHDPFIEQRGEGNNARN